MVASVFFLHYAAADGSAWRIRFLIWKGVVEASLSLACFGDDDILQVDNLIEIFEILAIGGDNFEAFIIFNVLLGFSDLNTRCD